MRKKHSVWRSLLRGLLFPLAAVVILLCFATALNHLDSGRKTEGLVQLEEAIRQSCAACYAAEGIYPPTLDYLQEHYGLQIDTRYTVHYTVIAKNLMPDITVLENRE